MGGWRSVWIAGLIVSIVALSANPAAAREEKYRSEGRLGVWMPELLGSANISRNASAFNANFRGNGTFRKRAATDFGWTTAIGRRSSGAVRYTRMADSGELDIPVTFQGTVFAANSTLDLDVQSLELTGAREIDHGAHGFIDYLYGLTWMRFDFRMTGGGLSQSDAYNFVLPAFGVGGEYWCDERFTFFTQAMTFATNRGDTGGMLRTLDAGVQFAMSPPCRGRLGRERREPVDWCLELAYRAQDFSGSDGPDHVKVDHEGTRLAVLGKF